MGIGRGLKGKQGSDQIRSLSVKLGVILVGLTIFGYAEVWGMDWKYTGEVSRVRPLNPSTSRVRVEKPPVAVKPKNVTSPPMLPSGTVRSCEVSSLKSTCIRSFFNEPHDEREKSRTTKREINTFLRRQDIRTPPPDRSVAAGFYPPGSPSGKP